MVPKFLFVNRGLKKIYGERMLINEFTPLGWANRWIKDIQKIEEEQREC
jgi:hypothetical protein